MNKKQILITVCLGLAACWLGVAIAGDINHSGDPAGGSGMPTLQEVYDYLVDGTAETPNDTFQEPTGAPGSTGKTTKNIYDDIKTKFDQCASATPDKVQSGVKFFSTDTAQWGVQTGTMPFAAVVETGQTGQQDANTPKADDGDADPPGAALPSPRFNNNGDGSVTDNLTGLIWLQNANCANTTMNWQPALNAVVELNTSGNMSSNNCGYTGIQTDWRLPTLRELQSLVHYGFSNPAVSNTVGAAKWSAGDPFNNVLSDYYWSSTSCSGSSTRAWGVNMVDGYVYYGNRTVSVYYVWPVRGGQ